MSEPFLNLGDVGSVVEGVGGGGRAPRVRSEEFHEDAELLGVVHDDVAIGPAGVRIFEVGEPFDFRRHIGQTPKLRLCQQPFVGGGRCALQILGHDVSLVKFGELLPLPEMTPPAGGDKQVIARLARFHQRSPDQLSDEEVRGYLLHLLRHDKLSASTLVVAVSALRFFYEHVLQKPPKVIEHMLPRTKTPVRRAQVYSVEELEAFFALPGLNRKHRAIQAQMILRKPRESTLADCLVPGRRESSSINSIRSLPIKPAVPESLHREHRSDVDRRRCCGR